MKTGSALLLAGAMLGVIGCDSMTSGGQPARSLGWQVPVGKGTVTSYAELERQGAPKAIGIVYSAAALEGLPAGSDDHHCVGRGHEGTKEAETKCEPTFEQVIPLPDVVAVRADMPFKWVLFNWNPAGHIPPGVYDVPHFDVHFMMAPIAEVFAIEPGPCGPELVRCDQFRIGKKPLPPNYGHPDFQDVEAVVPAMGNHLIDLKGPEFNKQPFTRSFIYGVYDGKVIFYEEMVTRSHILNKPNACTPIKATKAVAVKGYYPAVTCIRHNAGTGETTVSMEQFALRDASPPDAVAAK